MTQIPVTIAFSEYDHVRDISDGRVLVEGLDISWFSLDVPELFARFSRNREWEISEFGLGKYTAQLSDGDESITAIPVFPSRMFRLSAFYVREGSQLASAADLRGTRVGIPEWAQTACIYAKGWLAEDQGIDLREIEWIQAGVDQPGRTEKVRISPPTGLVLTPAPEKSLDQMLLDGEIDAVLSAQPPRSAITGGPVRRLFSDPQAIEADYFRRTGLLPIMHLVAMRTDVVAEHPWMPARLLAAFDLAKRNSVERVKDWKASRVPIVWSAHWAETGARLFEGDYWPYGVGANRRVLETFLRYARDQGILTGNLTVDDLFHQSVLES